MKICLYSSQLQAMAIIEAPDDISQRRNVGVCAVDDSTGFAGRMNSEWVRIPTASVVVEPLHHGPELHTLMAKSIDEQNDEIIAKLLKKSPRLYAF